MLGTRLPGPGADVTVSRDGVTMAETRRTTSAERVTLHRQRQKLGQRPVTMSEREIAYLLARDYELTRRDDRSIGRADRRRRRPPAPG